MASPLLIMRHGEALSGFPDHQRRLSDSGRREVSIMGAWLSAREDLELTKLRVVASPYARAQQTAALVVEALPSVVDIDTLDIITPDDVPEAVVEWLLGEADDVPLLIVSHMPLVAALTGLLVEGRSDYGVGFATAAIAELTGEVRASGCLSLRRLTTPAEVES
ncbi:phosphohistidine phosphatase SixA [Halomonas cupida]|uniref:Phosphohistidine phosphatase SixA n=2 Tax=Halomonas cupida TaxID=44933 RepID=A0A1M7EM95_9GAMM|nr:phosphohistidine phosphatase SixA [Halomonas cupida]GEN23182.1 phosphohistidine phosphatase SixA [Halomonas cupida]SHL92932.1 phosphohistidine phosphatase, SixA [Halomonas cupida]